MPPPPDRCAAGIGRGMRGCDEPKQKADCDPVLLDGSTASLANELRAIETVYGLPGVRQVASEIEAKEK